MRIEFESSFYLMMGKLIKIFPNSFFSTKEPLPIIANATKEGLIYFADAAHPMFNAALNYGWIKKGTDFENGQLANNTQSCLDFSHAINESNGHKWRYESCVQKKLNPVFYQKQI